MRLEDLAAGTFLVGLEPSFMATVITRVPGGEGSVQGIFSMFSGISKDRLLSAGSSRYGAAICLRSAEQ